MLRPGFRERVWALVRHVPAGHVTTYGQIATLLGSPRVARHVGYALSAVVPVPASAAEAVPWHRVLNARGTISHRDDFARAEHQRKLLEREGVAFDRRGAVDLERFVWHFPGISWPFRGEP